MDKKRIPTELEVSAYEQLTQAFSWSFQQDVITFLRMLHEKGIDLNWAIACIMIRQKMVIVDRKERRDARREWEQKARKCPKCDQVMYIAKVNDHPSRMIGQGYKTQWICPGNQFMQMRPMEACEFTEYSKRTISEWLTKLRINAERVKKMRHPFLREAKFDFAVELVESDLKENENAN